MNVQFPKSLRFIDACAGDVFSITIDGKKMICMKTDPVVDDNEMEYNAVCLTTGKHLCLIDEDEVGLVNGTYVVEG